MRAVSIRVAGPILFLIPVLFAVIALAALGTFQGRRAANDLTARIVDQVTLRITDQLDAYLTEPVELTAETELMIEDGELDPDDLPAWRDELLRKLTAAPDVSSLTFGNAAGEATWAIRYPAEPGLEYALKDEPDAEITEFTITEDRSLGERIASYPYDPRVRPWYEDAVSADEPTWSAVYPWVRRNGGTSTLGLAYVRPIRDGNGELLGVVSSDVGLLAVSEFLRGVEIGESGRCFLVGPDGHLLATSDGLPVLDESDERIAASESEDPLVRAISERVTGEAGAFEGIAEPRLFRINAGNARYRVEVEPFGNPWGLDWRIVTIVPESEVLATVQALGRQTWLFGTLLALLTLGLGIFASQWLVGPVLGLVDAVRRIGSGDLDTPVQVEGTKEFGRLSDELNAMSAALKDRLRLRQSLTLAMEIQQKLLPMEPPRVRGLDIAGHSTYCDETGGDYYDFLEVERTDQEDLVVVLGDVMGHGIAAALLMATARGILRSRATEEGSLGELLTHVNKLLEADTEGERFMTMVLMVIDPHSRRLRWASAGHDPAILYDPEADDFVELPDINGLPLGLVAEEDYREATRDGLEVGQIILVGTDGIWEALNDRDEAFGKGRLQEVIRAHRDQPADAIARALTNAIRTFRGAAHQGDDITFVLIKITPELAPSVATPEESLTVS